MSTEERIDVEQMYPPHVLRQYALLADGERGALIGPQGDIAWMCAPHWDSDAVFSSLIGGGGAFAVTPQDVRHVWGGYYEHGSLIWRSRWITNDGVIECREALAFPGDSDRVVLLRRIVAVAGAARVRVVLEPRPGFGRHGPGALHQDRCGGAPRVCCWCESPCGSHGAHVADRPAHRHNASPPAYDGCIALGSPGRPPAHCPSGGFTAPDRRHPLAGRFSRVRAVIHWQ